MIETFEKFVKSDNLQLWTESFGDTNGPAVLLIMGGMHQGIMWPNEFCTDIARHGYHVIRYDHRDTGQSSSVDFTKHPYRLDDLTRDAVAVLDGYGIRKAHVVGLSMGGFLAQLLALDYSDRVLTLTLMLTSPDQRVYFAATMGEDTSSYGLPPPSSEFLEHLRNARQNPPKTAEEAILNAVDGWRLCNGGRHSLRREVDVLSAAAIVVASEEPFGCNQPCFRGRGFARSHRTSWTDRGTNPGYPWSTRSLSPAGTRCFPSQGNSRGEAGGDPGNGAPAPTEPVRAGGGNNLGASQ